MAGKLEGTRTQNNLKEAFAGESMARNKYTFFAGEARKAGLLEISRVFERTANEDGLPASPGSSRSWPTSRSTTRCATGSSSRS